MSFVVSGLPLDPFARLFGLSDAALAERGVLRRISDKPVGYPCRVTLEDAPPGESLLLLNYEHQPADNPFRARHAIFVRESATATARFENQAPPVLAVRPFISLRAYDDGDMLVASEVSPGADLAAAIGRLLARPDAAYLHAHNAGHGCYAARIDRAA